jgi:hypothetical protein
VRNQRPPPINFMVSNPQLKHGETERRMQDLEEAVKQLQAERDALAVKADALERCLLQGEPGPNGVCNYLLIALPTDCLLAADGSA